MSRVYIAGPMTGREMLNFPAFFAAEGKLRAAGHDVVNPARLDGETPDLAHAAALAANHSWEYCLRRDLRLLLDCDVLVALPHWSTSRGAALEVSVAEALGMRIIDMRTAIFA